MKHQASCFSILVIFALLILPLAVAHVPLTGGDNEGLAEATYINDPTKSWVLYAELHEGGEAQYYRFDMVEQQRLRLMLMTPEESDFTPSLVIMSPLVASENSREDMHEDVPAFVEIPEDTDARVIEGQRDKAAYEPFTPSSYYFTVDVDMNVPVTGAYYVAIFEASLGGRYGLAIGYREAYGLDEWIRVPVDVVGVHLWEGQSLIFIFAPMLATMAIGLGLLVWRRSNGVKKPKTYFGIISIFAGLLYLGSGFIMFTQMFIALSRAPLVPEVAVTILFAAIPIILGTFTLRLANMRVERTSFRTRVYMFIVAVIALFTWSGILIGPILAILASILGSR